MENNDKEKRNPPAAPERRPVPQNPESREAPKPRRASAGAPDPAPVSPRRPASPAKENTAPKKEAVASPKESVTPKKEAVAPKRTVAASKNEDASPSKETPAPKREDSARKRDEAPLPKEHPEPKPKRKKSREGIVPALVKSAVYLVAVIVISLFLGFFVISVGNDVFAFVKSQEEITVTIPENATVETVADILEENGIIKYPKIFTLFAKLKKDDGEFIAGEYQVTPSTNYEMLLSAFKYRFVRTVVRLTIPEGYCCEEIIELFVSNGIGTRESFVEAINNTDYSEFRFVRELEEQGTADRYYRLEGYLYPDTYDF